MLAMWSNRDEISAMDLRTIADWNIRQRLLTIPGVSQVFTMGGERKQYQVIVDPAAMSRFDIALHEVEQAVSQSNANGTGGYLDRQGPNELLVRSLGRLRSIEELRRVPISYRNGQPVLLEQVAVIKEGAQIKRGDSAAFRRVPDSGSGESRYEGGDAVVFTINKQPVQIHEWSRIVCCKQSSNFVRRFQKAS